MRTPALDAMQEVLGTPPPVSVWSEKYGSCVTARWVHAPVDTQVEPMASHVIAAVFSTAGDVRCRYGTRSYECQVASGSINVVPEGIEGHCRIPRPVDGMQLILPDHYVEELCRQAGGPRSWRPRIEIGSRDAKAFRYLRFAAQHMQPRDNQTHLLVEETLEDFCLLYVKSRVTVPTRRVSGRMSLAHLQRVEDYMHIYLADQISLDTLADMVGLSRSDFTSSFRRCTGVAPSCYLSRLRVERASQLLGSRDDLTIAEIARLVGYPNPASFSRAFRDRYGVTARLFRTGRRSS